MALFPWSGYPVRNRNDHLSHALYNWVDDSVARLEDDFRRMVHHSGPHVHSGGFSVATTPQFHVNKTNNTVECDLATGCGDYFRPEDISLTVTGKNVEFSAKREEKSEDGKHYTLREVRRAFTIPDQADADKLQANLRPDGRLVLEAPLLQALPQADKPIPIEIKRS